MIVSSKLCHEIPEMFHERTAISQQRNTCCNALFEGVSPMLKYICINTAIDSLYEFSCVIFVTETTGMFKLSWI